MQIDHLSCRWLALIFCLCLCFGCSQALAAKPEDASPYPEALQITIQRETWQTPDGRFCETALPVTHSAYVNQVLQEAQQLLLQELAEHASGKQIIEQEATYRISGTSWAGFLLTGRVMETIDNPARKGEATQATVYMNYRVFTFDMETDKAITLADVFPEDSEVWNTIATMLKERHFAYYSSLSKEENVINGLCEKEAMLQMPFLPSAGRLTLVTPLEEVLPNHWQLVNTFLPYPDFRSAMTEEAFEQTDNSQRRIIAITYDDGPNIDNTPKMLRALNNYGANASFFLVGRQLEKLPYLAQQELDYGHTVGNHTYKPQYDFQVTKAFLEEDKQQCTTLHNELTGLPALLFRAPGGNADGYLRHQIGWPIIQWRFSAGDTGNNNAYQLADRIYFNAGAGDIILMHDIYYKTAKGSEMFLSRLAADGFLFATVDEMLYLYGIVPQPDTVYYDAFTPPVTEWK